MWKLTNLKNENYKKQFLLKGCIFNRHQNLHNLKTENYDFGSLNIEEKSIPRTTIRTLYRRRWYSYPGALYRVGNRYPHQVPALYCLALHDNGYRRHLWQRWKEAKIWTIFCGTQKFLITRFSPSAFGDGPKFSEHKNCPGLKRTKKSKKIVNFIFKHQTTLLEINNKHRFDVTWRKQKLNPYTRYCQELKCIIAHILLMFIYFCFFLNITLQHLLRC